MMCTEVQHEDEDEDIVVYRDQGISTEEYEKTMYGNLTRRLNKTMPDENIHNVSQSDVSLNENPTGNIFNNEATVEQGPTGDDDEIKLWKAWMMEMLMNDGNISTTMMNGLEQVSQGYKKFLYARATHSNHVIQYHMQQIMERQKVVNKYRSMMMEEMSLIPLESNSYKSDLVVILHNIQLIEVDNFWHLKTFGAALTDLQRRWDEEIHEQKDRFMHCT